MYDLLNAGKYFKSGAAKVVKVKGHESGSFDGEVRVKKGCITFTLA